MSLYGDDVFISAESRIDFLYNSVIEGARLFDDFDIIKESAIDSIKDFIRNFIDKVKEFIKWIGSAVKRLIDEIISIFASKKVSESSVNEEKLRTKYEIYDLFRGTIVLTDYQSSKYSLVNEGHIYYLKKEVSGNSIKLIGTKYITGKEFLASHSIRLAKYRSVKKDIEDITKKFNEILRESEKTMAELTKNPDAEKIKETKQRISVISYNINTMKSLLEVICRAINTDFKIFKIITGEASSHKNNK